MIKCLAKAAILFLKHDQQIKTERIIIIVIIVIAPNKILIIAIDH
jgi:hypothetical protein